MGLSSDNRFSEADFSTRPDGWWETPALWRGSTGAGPVLLCSTLGGTLKHPDGNKEPTAGCFPLCCEGFDRWGRQPQSLPRGGSRRVEVLFWLLGESSR